MPKLSLDGVDVAYFDSGASGTPIVLSHGFLMDQHAFDPQVHALEADFRIIVWDQRGFGATATRGAFSLWDSARDLVGLLDHLGVEQAVLGGTSQGGFVTLRAALLVPDRVLGLILIATQADAEVASDGEDLIETWLQLGPEPVRERLADRLFGAGDWSAQVQDWDGIDRQQLRWAHRALMDREAVSDRLGEIDCPALILHGTADTAVPIENGRRMQAGLGGPVVFRAIEGGCHTLTLSHPGEVSAEIRRFVQDLAVA